MLDDQNVPDHGIYPYNSTTDITELIRLAQCSQSPNASWSSDDSYAQLKLHSTYVF